MKINGHEIPVALQEELKSERARLAPDEEVRLCGMLKHIETPIPTLYDLRGIQLANQLWISPEADYYLGEPSSAFPPGNIDPQLTLIIGHAEPDSPIALDYRATPARVVYLGDIENRCFWIELSSDYSAFLAALRTART